jgi:AraC-like DNA-binding protein
MKILTAPRQSEDPGQIIEIPDTLKKTHRVLWATPQCRRYPFGIILNQEFVHKYYQINIYYIESKEETTLYACFDKPAIALQVFLSGSVTGLTEGVPVLELPPGRFSLVYIPEGTHEMRLNSRITEACLLVFEKSYLAELTEGWPMQKELMELIDSSSKTGMPCPLALLSYEAKAEISRMHASTKKDYLLVLELKSCIAKLLGAYLTSIADKMGFMAIANIPYRDILIEIWEAIKADPNINEHTLSKLASSHNLHTKTLGRNFTAMFGTSISNFVRQQCMQKAYILVTTTAMPLQDIAFESGYSELTNFNRAFKLHFKRSPGSLRSSQ